MPRPLLYLLLCLPVGLAASVPVGYFFAPDFLRAGSHAETVLAVVADDGGALPTEAEMKRLAETDPVAFVEAAIRRYDREVKGYRCTLHKQERVDGKLQRSEEIDVQFREEPFSVLFDWREGARLAQKTLYVKGENGEKLLVRPTGLASLVGVVERDADGADARKSGRYPLTEFGMKIGTQRTLAAWIAARKQGELHVEFLGEVKVKEAGDRVCYKFRRTKYKEPEDDGITESTLYFDKETWLQVGSVLKGVDNQLIGEYFFRDVQLNPDLKADVFTREMLRK